MFGEGYKILFPNIYGDSNIFISKFDGTDIKPVTTGLNGCNYLEDVSPDGRQILFVSFPLKVNGDFSNAGNLYTLDLGSTDPQPRKIASLVNGAAWLDNSRVVYIGMFGGHQGLFAVNTDGTNFQSISKLDEGEVAIRIFSATATEIIWMSHNLQINYLFTFWRSNSDGSSQIKLGTNVENFEEPAMSQDGKLFAWWTRGTSAVHYASPDNIASSHDIQLPEVRRYLVFPSPDGSKILIYDSPDINGINETAVCYLHNVKTSSLVKCPIAPPRTDDLVENISHADWSPDSRMVILENEIIDKARKSVVGVVNRLLNVETLTFMDNFLNHLTLKGSSPDLIQLIASPIWLPIQNK